jgi:hypothetical protein
MGCKPSDYQKVKLMMEAILPPGCPSFDEVDEATDWIHNVTSATSFSRVALQADKKAMKHFVWHMGQFPGTNRLCTIQGIPAWVGAGKEARNDQAD